MEIAPTIGAATRQAGGNGALNGESLAETFDNFLTLLTAQLQNQDPLSPLDTNKFTEQLVNFTGVEQQINTNRKLDQLLQMQAMNQTSAAVDYIGKTVRANGDKIMLQSGSAEFSYELGGNAAQTEILIVNGQGETVRRLAGPTDAGEHTLTWDGKSDDGALLDDGVYGVQVRAVDREDNTVPTSLTVGGQVTGVEAGESGLQVLIGDLSIPLTEILSVRASDPIAAPAG